MRRLSVSTVTIAIAAALFVVLAPLSADMYNTIFHRGFLDLALRGNPYALAPVSSVQYRGIAWPFDFPYPPFTMLFILPGWAAYRLLHSEAAYQVLCKLPLFLSAVATQVLALRLARRHGRSPRQTPLAAWYVLLPGVLLLTTIHGGFDAVSALLILLAVYCYEEERRAASALAIGLAGALRLFPLVVVPVYLAHLWRTGERRRRRIVAYALLSAVPLALTCGPFIVADRASFFGFLSQGQTTFGPFSTLNIATAVIRRLGAPLGYLPEFQGLGPTFVLLTLLALAATYVWVAARPSTPARDGLLVLLVFFLVYPKGHGLYITALVPLALVEPLGLAAFVWVPAALWMLTVNGAFRATGLYYWFAPLTGTWQRVVPEPVAGTLTVVLSAAQALVLVGAAAQTAWQSCARQPAFGSAGSPGAVGGGNAPA